MINIQNEIKYAIAQGMLKKLLLSGHITPEEYEKAHSVVAEHFCPLAVRR